MKTINSSNDLPITGKDQFAVLEFSSIYVPGDQRSRDAPGHGYPAGSEPTSYLHVFESQKDLEAWIECYSDSKRYSDSKSYVVLSIRRLKVKTTTSIELET